MMVNGKLEEGIIQSYVVIRIPRGEDPQQVNVTGSHISETLKKLIEVARGGDQFHFFQIKGRWTGEAEVRDFGSMSFLVKDDVSSSVNNIDPNDIKSVNVNKDEVNGNSVTIEMKDGTIRVLKGEELKQWEKYNEGDRVRIFSNKQPIYTIVDENPEFSQGQAALFKWLGSNIQYPKEARDNKIEGTVYVGFVVNQDGAISDVVVKRGIGGGCNQEAVRVISAMPNWKPGKLKGQFVRVAYTLPIKFKIDQNNTNIESKTQQQSNVEAEKNANDQIYTIVDQNPEFPQGQAALFKWLGENIKYPVIARRAGGQGTVYVGFVVEVDGSITNVNIKRDAPVILRDTITITELNGIKGNKIVERTDYSLGREAVRVISAMPKWKPGKSKGVPVRVAYTLPIKFKLE
jgi:TonB family protein